MPPIKKLKSQKTPTAKKSIGEKEVADDMSGTPDLPEDFLVVGIGASAGGIQALKEFFENVPADSGMAYVVILHLSPDHDSRLAEVLQQSAAIPVTQVKQRVRVVPNHVYVVSPDKHLTMTAAGDIEVSPNLRVEDRRAPVDIFFRTLAESLHARAVAVVLSGTGANGSMGIKRVKERGGAAFVQNPREAEFSEMPRNSIATDLIDRILNVAEIPAHIIGYKENLGTIEIPVEPESRPEEQQQALREIFTQLRLRTGHDFSNYKRATILRRIERRINVRQLEDLPAYAAFVRENTDEATALLKDLLISVTNFFRDREAFQFLETDVLPKIFHGKRAEDTVRIWVAGCATGEEAYSMAMLCAERTVGAVDAPQVQIFASDIDEQAIVKAREGFYTLNDAADVAPERLRRFFTKENEGYRVRRDLREMVLFANHNILKDPAFSHLDAVTCRNMLIYLNPTAQERVMETFHFALEPGGFLLLGNSETVDGAGDLYATVSKEHHIFQSRHVSTRITYPIAESSSRAFRFDKMNYALAPAPPPPPPEESETRPLERVSYGDLHLRRLEQYTPSVLINEQHDIVHIAGGAARFLQMKTGEPTQNLLKLIVPELRLELRTALYQAAERQTNVEVKNLKIPGGERGEIINLYVRPVAQTSDDTARGFVLVFFETAREEGGGENRQAVYSQSEPMIGQLEEELVRSQSQLRRTVEQFEVQAEELKASNEELQAINEELRSSAEELETSKGELQSVNEELITVNQELKVKIEELSQSTSDFSNLINSTDIATIFLDRSFRVHTFTPAASRLFNLIPADSGRPISDITHRLEENGLIGDAETVLGNLQTIEREARTNDGRTYLMRVLPYRTAEDRIGGVVATFLDITERKQAEEAKFHLASIVESSEDSMLTINFDRIITSWNKAAEKLYGYPAKEAIGKPLTMLTLPEDLKQVLSNVDRIEQSRKVETFDAVRVHKDGHEMNLEVVLSPVKDDKERLIGVSIIARDVTERRKAVEALARSEEKYRTLFDSIDEGFCIIEVLFDENEKPYNYSVLEANNAFKKQTGLVDAVGKTAKELIPELEQYWFDIFGRVAKTGVPEHFENEVKATGYFFEYYAFYFETPEENRVAVLFKNITERKRREANLAFLAETSADFAPLFRAEEIMERVGKRLAEHLDLSRCNFSIVDEEADHIECLYDWRRDDSMPDLSGAHRISTFLSEEGRRHYAAGKFAVINDVRNNSLLNPATFEKFDELGLRSVIDAPYLKNGRWKFLLTAARSEAGEWRTDEIELIRELAERVYIRVERARAEEALRESEEKYRQLFDSIDEGFCIIEVLYDESGRAADFVYLETNPAFAAQSGLENVVGRRISEIIPTLDQFWYEIYGKVALSGESARFEHEVTELNRKYDIFASRVGDDSSRKIAIVFQDITERKRDEDQIQRTGKTFFNLIQSAPFGVYLVNSEFLLVEVSAVANKVFSNVHPLLNRDFAEVLQIVWTEPFLSEALNRFRHTLATGEEYHSADTVEERNDTNETESYDWLLRRITIPDGTFGVVCYFWDMTDRRRAEKALRESEGRLRALVENLPGGAVFIVDKNLRYLIAEGEALANAGLAPEDLVGRTVNEAMPPELAASYESLYRTALAGEAFEHEHDAHGRAFITRGLPLKSAAGEVYAVLAISYDITERKQAEENLRESEEKYRGASEFNSAVLSSLTAQIAVLDADGDIATVNEEWRRFSSKNGGEHARTGVGVNYLEACRRADGDSADDARRVLDGIQSILQGEIAQFSHEYPCHSPVEKRWFLLNVTPLQGGHGGAVVSHLNITTRKLAEQALYESEERLRLIINSVEDYAITTTDAAGVINGWNPGAEKMFGYAESEIIGQPYEILYTPEDREKGVPAMELQTAFERGSVEDERLHARKDGSRFFSAGVIQIFKDGKIDGFVKIARDMTERIQAEQIGRDKGMLQKLVGAQEDERKRIARDLHDELGQQLTALRLKLDIAKKLCLENNELCGKIDEIELIAQSIDNGVDFLAWELRPAALDDLGLVAALGNYVKQWSHHSGVSAELLASKLKSVRFAPEVETNLYRIVQEALNNTHKHAKAKSVEVVLERRDGLITLLIEDNGKGFNPNDKKNKSKGMGLIGMNERAQLVGGELEIESAPGKGTTVFVRVPAERVKRTKSDGK